MRRGPLTGFTAALAATAVLSGCAAPLDSPLGRRERADAAPAVAGTSAAPLAARDALVSAFSELGKTTYRINMELPGMAAEMLADPVAQTSSAVMHMTSGDGESMEMELYADGTVPYLRMDWGALAGAPGFEDVKAATWLRLDPERSGELSIGLDEYTMMEKSIGNALISIDSSTAHTFAGRLDMTRLNPRKFAAMDTAQRKAMRDLAKDVAFRAETDSKGRISYFAYTLEMSGQKIDTILRYSRYGEAKVGAKPLSAVDAPDSLYLLFGGN